MNFVDLRGTKIPIQAAALLEKAAGDLLRLKLGQVPPGETLLIRLEMTMELQTQNGCLAGYCSGGCWAVVGQLLHWIFSGMDVFQVWKVT